MIDKITAQKLVEAHLSGMGSHLKDDSYVLVDGATIEKEYGWIFQYQSEKFRLTHDPRYLLLGNAPILVNKTDGAIHYLHGRTVEECTRNYELQHRSSK